MSARAARISVDVSEPMRIELERIAAARNVSEADLVSEAIARFVEEEAEYLPAIDEALEELDKGAFVSGENVVKWMRSWGTDKELPTPQADIFPAKAP